MFDKEVRLTGKHAHYMILLANNLGETNAKLFNRNIDVYVQAPIVGFLYKRKGSKDNDMKDSNGKVYDAHILKDQMLNAKDNLVFNMQLILLFDSEYEQNEENRIDHAFRSFGKDECDFELFESYLLGGIEVLYEHLIADAAKTDDFIENLSSFVDDINERFNQNVNKEKLLDSLN